MSDLQNQTPANTYKGLLQVNDYTNGVDATAKYVQDGEGTDSSLAISTGNIGIGTASPDANLHIEGSGVSALRFGNIGDSSNSALRVSRDDTTIGSTNPLGYLEFGGKATTSNVDTAHAYVGAIASGTHSAGDNPTDLTFGTTPDGSSTISEAMRITASGKVGIGTDSPSVKLDVQGSSNTASKLTLTRTDVSRTAVLSANSDSSTCPFVGSQSNDDFAIFANNSAKMIIGTDGNVLPDADNTQDLGSASKRWDVIYVKDTNITTSDREQKQDIEELSEAETRVAQACKGLLRKYRWKDQVAAKGDEARIHFGIIAQDLEDAFTAEGLDAGRYGMFVKNTWWTADRVIPAVEAVEAVEAVYDEEGNELSPAVEAVEAQPERTVTDIFHNSEDAPEGATEITQRGVRYSELLAFIISAI